MCGIAAVVAFDGRPAERETLARMASSIRHRGPDGHGLFTDGAVGLAHQRLAIIDLSPDAGQPMTTPDGRLTIVYNGEIYNYLELRDELKGLGHEFRTTSDTEVLLRAYQQWGADCVTRFNGMWAFVIYDKPRRTLCISRDRFGIKPLYVFETRDVFVAASEPKAVFASGFCGPSPDWRTVSRFLINRRLDDEPATFYRDIRQVPPGSILEVEVSGRKRERSFWSLQQAAVTEPPEQPAAAFRDLLADSVRLRMRSDVPVGVCLSGGIDSNAIMSSMASLWPASATRQLSAFSYLPTTFGEEGYVQEAVADAGASLHKLSLTPRQLWDLLPAALWHYDEPVHSPTAIVGFALMRLAKASGVTVVLNGQGSDEVNGGYHSYFDDYWRQLLRAGRAWRAWTEIQAYTRGHGKTPAKEFFRVAVDEIQALFRHVPGYGTAAVARRSDRLRRRSWVASECWDLLPENELLQARMTLAERLRFGVEQRPLPLYLRVEDRNSMAHAVEARLPFLDYRLVSLAFSLPAEWKLKGPWNKFIVREAIRGTVPEAIRTRLDKMGFPTEAREWFAGPWYEPTMDVLQSQALRESGIVNTRLVRRDLERHKSGEIDASTQLFHVAEFALWLERTGADVTAARQEVASA